MIKIIDIPNLTAVNRIDLFFSLGIWRRRYASSAKTTPNGMGTNIKNTGENRNRSPGLEIKK
jgi:hypothetical protein